MESIIFNWTFYKEKKEKRGEEKRGREGMKGQEGKGGEERGGEGNKKKKLQKCFQVKLQLP